MSLSDLQISEKGCDANSTYKILGNQTYVPQVNQKILNTKEKELKVGDQKKTLMSLRTMANSQSVSWVL